MSGTHEIRKSWRSSNLEGVAAGLVTAHGRRHHPGQASVARGSLARAEWAAASRATGTRNGEQDT